MKIRQLLPLAFLLVGSSAFAGHKHIIQDSHHLLKESKQMTRTFQHNLVARDKAHLVRESQRLTRSVAHFNRIWHKKFLGITVGHKHKQHSKMLRDFNTVKRNMRHLSRRFGSKSRPHHVKTKMNHLKMRYRHLHRRVHGHAG